jgi:hypothetical protein
MAKQKKSTRAPKWLEHSYEIARTIPAMLIKYGWSDRRFLLTHNSKTSESLTVGLLHDGLYAAIAEIARKERLRLGD